MSEELGMVERYVGYDANFRRNDIGGIEPATHTDLNHGIINIFFGEPLERHHHRELEKRRLVTLVILFTLFPVADEIQYPLFRYHFAVDTHSFAKINEMGRCVKSGFVSLLHEY